MKFTNTLHDTLFKDFIHSTLIESNEDYVGNCLQLRQEDPDGVLLSNHNGWHSKRFGGDTYTTQCGKEVLDHMVHECDRYVRSFCLNEFRYSSRMREWWVNIGSGGSYNDPHTHGRATLIGIIFIQVPEGSGDLVLSRNDGSIYSSLYHRTEKGMSFQITPEVNRFYVLPGHLWHWVDRHMGFEDRISISINYH